MIMYNLLRYLYWLNINLLAVLLMKRGEIT
ncbi:hypothetical protein SCTVLC_0453 [Serratia symbiotica SCt-VLC]|uniref:Uncharacterized protein n=1 Tax=Serratia symbiotica SCt-VLC TaxID=1347341 RepID=A0A068RC84_9GAMM|nr:hypothetical protein SCTVLC_0453 [Serratia symbiotica SCt-VLC]